MLACSVGCADFLDVQPKDKQSEKQLFATRGGYYTAVNGIYNKMASAALYGKNLSYELVDVISKRYQPLSVNTYLTALSTFAYTDNSVETELSNTWTAAYNTILNCNVVLENIDKSEGVLSTVESRVLKGEMLAVRAFLHFDMLRLFAPAPIVDDNSLYIPYFEKFPSYGENNLTVTEVLNRVTADLIKAKDLVASYDTLSNENFYRLTLDGGAFDVARANGLPEDVFYAYRRYRMNYPAITSLLARVYNYAGKHDEAFACANEVMELRDEYERMLFIFSTRENALTDRKMKQDLIFALSSPKLYENYLSYATDHGSATGDARFVLRDWNAAFDDPADYRKDVLTTPLSSSSSYYMPARNIQIASEENDLCPIIRYSELYYIVAEYYASKGNWREAVNQLDNVREGRNCTKGRLTNVNDYESFRTELLKEVKREYITEGQLFFYHKKLNVKCTNTMTTEDFVLPLPDSENIN